MSEAEAADIITTQFAGEAGILARTHAGLGLDEHANTLVFEALGVLREAWSERLRVPKRIVRAFVYIDDSIGELSDDSPRLKPGASGMTLVCRPTPIVRFHPVERALLTDSTIGWHRFKDGDAVTRRNALRRNR